MKPPVLVEKLLMATEGSNELSGEVFMFLVNEERAQGLFTWQEGEAYMYPLLTESLDLSTNTFVEKRMTLDISITNHICKLKVFIGSIKVCDVSAAGKDCIPRAICAAGITFIMEGR